MPYFLQWSCLFSEESSGSEEWWCTVPFIAIYSPLQTLAAALWGNSTTLFLLLTHLWMYFSSLSQHFTWQLVSHSSFKHTRTCILGWSGCYVLLHRKKGERGKKHSTFYAIGCLPVSLTGVHTSLSLNLLLLPLIKRRVERITCHFRSVMLRIVYLCKDLPYALTQEGSCQ